MFNHRHYVPILKLKRGERRALSLILPTDAAHITPLFEIADANFDPTPGNTIDADFDSRISLIAANIAQCWPNPTGVFIDGLLIEPTALVAGTTHPVTRVFDDARALGLSAVPVTGLGRDAAYQGAVAAIAAIDGRGAAIRITLEDLAVTTLGQSIDALLTKLSLTSKQCHLILDLEEINEPLSPLVLAIRHTINIFPYLNNWLSFTIAAAAFPPDLTSVAVGVGLIPRLDWLLYQQFVSQPMNRIPSFGDYTTRHPEMFDGDPAVINASCKHSVHCSK
ncbi:MAG: hypothetical protein HC888_17740 [Candidatus Competibacteraceae bacterium]|nr:hypothetical protein [Candidatus Competibacteraceae bacterium]